MGNKYKDYAQDILTAVGVSKILLMYRMIRYA